MKLASYLSYGVATFGVVSGDGVVTLGGKLKGGYKTLVEAIAAGAFDEIAKSQRVRGSIKNCPKCAFCR